MKSGPSKYPQNDFYLLFKSFFVALVIETSLLAALSMQFYLRMEKFSIKNAETSQMIEVRLYEPPETPQQRKSALIHDKKTKTIQNPREKAKIIAPSGKTSSEDKNTETSELKNFSSTQTKENQNRGPLLLFAPKPKLPKHLQDEGIETFVSLIFFIEVSGKLTIRLTHSSGYPEIDAICVKTAQLWRFSPSQNEGNSVASKYPVRFVFTAD